MAVVKELYDRFIDLELIYNEYYPVQIKQYHDPNSSDGYRAFFPTVYGGGAARISLSGAWNTKKEAYLNAGQKVGAKKRLKLSCPKDGIKPAISFQYSRVPGNLCYNVTIKITNLYLKVDVIWIDEIKVIAGYRSSLGIDAAEFTAQVFNAYTPEPGPDGYTVFECLIASAATKLFDHRPVVFSVLNDTRGKANSKYSVSQVIHYACEQLNLTAYLFMSKQLEEMAFSDVNIEHIQYSSVYKFLCSLQDMLKTKVSNIGHDIELAIYDDKVYYVEKDENKKAIVTESSKFNRNVKILKRVSSADWNSAMLSIKAPWSPDVAPGSIIAINPKYYKGSTALPNLISRKKGQVDPDEKYYVLSSQVSFSTQDENEMLIMAIPFHLSPSVNYETKKIDKDGVEIQEGVIDIVLGKEDAKEQAARQKAHDISQLSLDMNYNRKKILGGETLSTIASGSGLPAMQCTYLGDTVSIPASECWYPIIMVLTATQMRNKPSERYKIDLSNPNSLREGYYLALPSSSTTWKQMQTAYKESCKQIFQKCYAFYSSNPQTASWAKNLNKAALLIDKGVFQ